MTVFFSVLFVVHFFCMISCSQKTVDKNKKTLERTQEETITKIEQLDSIQPTIITYDSIVDVGLVKKKNTEAVFILKNIGKNPLHIAEISPSCGCSSSTKAPDKPIDIGKSFEIRVEIDMDRVEKGNFEKTLTVLSNSQERVLFLRIIGKKE